MMTRNQLHIILKIYQQNPTIKQQIFITPIQFLSLQCNLNQTSLKKRRIQLEEEVAIVCKQVNKAKKE